MKPPRPNNPKIMPTIRHLIQVKATPKAVYGALATEVGLRSWWTADAEGGSTEGENLTVGFYHRAVVFRFTVTALKPNEKVVWLCHGDDPDWNNTQITWQIEPTESGATIKFFHADWLEEDDHFASSNTTWGMLMHQLKGCLEGSVLGPKWPE